MSRILLADDSPQALRLAEQILTAQGLDVVSVTDGAVALRRLGDVNPDLLISDVYLPTKSAFDLARFMRSQKQYRDVPVIFAAAPADKFEEQDARNAGRMSSYANRLKPPRCFRRFRNYCRNGLPRRRAVTANSLPRSTAIVSEQR